ncbi:MAG: hypothetical protein QXQ81_03655 [Candidatus Thorarchaeota archaeon]
MRLNRGTASINELLARLGTSGRQFLLIVHMRHGNPSEIQIVQAGVSSATSVQLEGVVLRRELSRGSLRGYRARRVVEISLPHDSPRCTRDLADMLSRITGLAPVDAPSPRSPTDVSPRDIIVRLDPLPGMRTLWSHYNAATLDEIGPRIRVVSLRGDLIHD